MKKYWVEVTYGFYIDAENEEDAENWGWDQWIHHPQTGKLTQPHKSNAELSEEVSEKLQESKTARPQNYVDPELGW